MWARDNIKNFHVNMCTYYSKGTADYVAVWDFDEFFQPRGDNKNILDVLKSVDFPVSKENYLKSDKRVSLSLNETKTIMEEGWTPRLGMADGHPHPLCYLILNSEVTYISKRNEYSEDPLVVSNCTNGLLLLCNMLYHDVLVLSCIIFILSSIVICVV